MEPARAGSGDLRPDPSPIFVAQARAVAHQTLSGLQRLIASLPRQRDHDQFAEIRIGRDQHFRLGLIERGAERSPLIEMRQQGREFAHSDQCATIDGCEESTPDIGLGKDALPRELFKEGLTGFAQFTANWQRFTRGSQGDRVPGDRPVPCVRTTRLGIIRPSCGQTLKLLFKFGPKTTPRERENPVPAHPVRRQRSGEPIQKNPHAGVCIET